MLYNARQSSLAIYPNGIRYNAPRHFARIPAALSTRAPFTKDFPDTTFAPLFRSTVSVLQIFHHVSQHKIRLLLLFFYLCNLSVNTWQKQYFLILRNFCFNTRFTAYLCNIIPVFACILYTDVIDFCVNRVSEITIFIRRSLT